MAVTFRVNTREFDNAIKVYRQFSRRAPKVICDTKAFYIARRAVVETVKSPAKEIRKFIRSSSGKVIGKIINKRRGERGEKGLYGDAMADAVGLVLAARLRSIGFLRSGWVQAIKTLEPLAEKRGGLARTDKKSKEVGVPKGYANPSPEKSIGRTIIANMAAARWDKGEAGRKGEAALQRAFSHETRSMLEYVERKMKQGASEAGIKTA